MILLQLLFITFLSYFFVKVIVKYAHQLKFLDVPNDRSHHCTIVPSGGGIGFILAITIGIGFFESNLLLEFWYIFLALSLVSTIGIIDDRYEVSAKWKFLVIFVAVFIMWFFGTSIYSLGTWFGYELSLPPLIALLFTMFTLAGFTNALNLIDGLDGLASSVSIVILSFFAVIGLIYHNHFIFILSLFTISGLVGFLIFNWNPAKIFMGDSGSLSLGFVISILAVMSLEYIHPVIILYLTAIPIIDTLVVMVRRVRRGKSPFRPDKTHIHHILVKFFEMDVRKTVTFLVILQIIFSSIGYLLIGSMPKNNAIFTPVLAMIGFALMFVLFYMIFTGMKRRQIALDKKS